MAQIKRSRFKDLIILLLVAALAASLIVGIPAFTKMGDVRGEYIQQMQKECSEALDKASRLSRTDGSDYRSDLTKILSNLYAIRSINNLYNSLNGKTLVSTDQLQTLLNTVDRYMSDINTGLVTGINQTNLQNALEELQQALNELN